MINLLRSIVSVIVGLLVISFIAETIEFLLVTAINGSVTSDPGVYFGVRNRPLLLALKLVYNSLASLIGGYTAAWIAGRAGARHAMVLAAVQALALVWGMTASPYAQLTPLWMWITLILVMTPAIVTGGALRARRAREGKAKPSLPTA
jgi:hypothetical protein